MSLLKTNETKNYRKSIRVRNVSGGQRKPRKQSKEKIIKATEDRIIRDIRNFFEKEEEDYYKPVRVGNFWSKLILNAKVMVIEIKPSQSKNTSMKVSLT